jgi:hypothetical protein
VKKLKMRSCQDLALRDGYFRAPREGLIKKTKELFGDPTSRKNFPSLEKKCPNLGSLLLSGAVMWPSQLVVLYFFESSIARGSFCAKIRLY